MFGCLSYDDFCLPSATRVVRTPFYTKAYNELFAHSHENFKEVLFRASRIYPDSLAAIERKKSHKKKTSKRAGASSKQNNKGLSKAQVQAREMDLCDLNRDHNESEQSDDADSEFEAGMHMRDNDSFFIDPSDYFSLTTKTTSKQQQEQEKVQLIHTDSPETSSDESQCEQDCEVKCGDHSPAEKLGSERSLKASLGGEDKPSDSVDTVNFYLYNTVPSGPKTNFSTLSTPHNQAHIDSPTASPPTAPQKAPLQIGVHEKA
jgi:hypothetical protein